MKIKNLLEDLKRYFVATRKCGHTQAMLQVAQNVDSVVILTASVKHSIQLKKQAPKSTRITLDTPNALRGLCQPLLIDNEAMELIIRGALEEIERLERRVAELTSP